MGLLITFILVIFSWVLTVCYDYSTLTHSSYQAILIDKWHEERCTPMVDDKGNYIGESCSDIYTVALDVDGDRRELQLSNQDFKNLRTGRVSVGYDTGMLGFKHNIKISQDF